MTPWFAVIFAVDPGNKSSGWSSWMDGRLGGHGTAKNLKHGLAAAYKVSCANAEHLYAWDGDVYSYKDSPKRPFVLVIEKHKGFGKWGHKAAVGMERAVGEVTGEAKRIGIPKARVHRVYPEDWRRPTIGGARRTSAQWKIASITTCKRLFNVDVGDDEAEAILIGYWATMAPELVKYMPKKVRDAHA